MAALTTMAVVGAAVVGAAATVHQVQQQKSAAKKQQAELKRQQEEARTIAREQAALRKQRGDADADIQLGRGAGEPGAENETAEVGTAVQTGGVTQRVGGLSRRRTTVGL